MKKALISQYRAASTMLANTIDQCPDKLWANKQYASPYWQIAYHALHFTAFYLSENEDSFTPWPDHIAGIHQLGRPFALPESYSKAALIALAAKLGEELHNQIDEQRLSAPSGFEWLPMNKLELHLYNIRHLQHHTGQLIERLHQNGVLGISWVGYVQK